MSDEMAELRERRQLGGYAVRKIAEMTGIERSLLARYESGDRPASVEITTKMRAAITALELGDYCAKACYLAIVGSLGE